jgi:hypothetical protein
MAAGALRDVRRSLREDDEARATAPLLRALPTMLGAPLCGSPLPPPL